MAQATCATCRWWTRHEGMRVLWGDAALPVAVERDPKPQRDGTCRRMPAALTKDEADWCGEHPMANSVTVEPLNLTPEQTEAMKEFWRKRYGAPQPIVFGTMPVEVHGAKPSKIGE